MFGLKNCLRCEDRDYGPYLDNHRPINMFKPKQKAVKLTQDSTVETLNKYLEDGWTIHHSIQLGDCTFVVLNMLEKIKDDCCGDEKKDCCEEERIEIPEVEKDVSTSRKPKEKK